MLSLGGLRQLSPRSEYAASSRARREGAVGGAPDAPTTGVVYDTSKRESLPTTRTAGRRRRKAAQLIVQSVVTPLPVAAADHRGGPNWRRQPRPHSRPHAEKTVKSTAPPATEPADPGGRACSLANDTMQGGGGLRRTMLGGAGGKRRRSAETTANNRLRGGGRGNGHALRRLGAGKRRSCFHGNPGTGETTTPDTGFSIRSGNKLQLDNERAMARVGRTGGGGGGGGRGVGGGGELQPPGAERGFFAGRRARGGGPDVADRVVFHT